MMRSLSILVLIGTLGACSDSATSGQSSDVVAGADGTDSTDKTDGADSTDKTDGTDTTDQTDGTDQTDTTDQTEPCSAEAQSITGDDVDFKVLPMPEGCEVVYDGPQERKAPEITFASSEAEVLAIFSCDGATPSVDVDFSKFRIAIVRGVHEHDSGTVNTEWAVESNGKITVDVTFEGYCSGIAPAPLPYLALIRLPLAKTPAEAQVCYLPADEICGRLP